ncbi:39S ribosomal protein L4, mitochondrial [Lutzomyia longipalpis]|uniref:39S ribosomal protein L4, mitochondrial n=1 Tax=Lutzomyia longipalpis TaxID=7200 RepID=UPI00248416A6|nr:39S ribosomal protein L4, mitochondrial [Lutzomyia longipalpis]
MFRTVKNLLFRRPHFCTSVQNVITPTDTLPVIRTAAKARQAWVENVDTLESKKLEIIELAPEVFGAMPRIDIIHQNVEWQRKYRYVSFAHAKLRFECRGGGRKPWPQKGSGRARHGSIRSPLWRGGGVSHGPRSPTTHFYMLPYFIRVMGLTSTLSVKLAQDDLFVVNNLEIPVDDPKYLQELIDARKWGPSVLIVDESDIFPYNITAASEQIPHVAMMPVYGLNVYSMLKYHTLVLTKDAVRKLEERLLYQLTRTDNHNLVKKFRVGQ